MAYGSVVDVTDTQTDRPSFLPSTACTPECVKQEWYRLGLISQNVTEVKVYRIFHDCKGLTSKTMRTDMTYSEMGLGVFLPSVIH